MIAAICCSLSAIVFNSCKKPGSSPDSANFIGRWAGTGMLTENGVPLGAVTDTIVFIAGSDGNHVIVQDTGSCKGGTVVTFVLNGNAISLPTTTVIDGCGNKSTNSATGNLNGGTLTLTLQGSSTEDIPGGSSTGGDTIETINATIAMTLTKK